MIPKSLSATSLEVAEACMARWEVEHFHRSKGMSGRAATLGSSVHGGLEMYVKQMLKTGKPPTLAELLDFYKMSFMMCFGTAEASGDEYEEGVVMLKDWFKRTVWDGVTVLSIEVKDHFDVMTSIGAIPLNYIWDRFDQTGPNEYRVMDYKTNKWGLNPGDLKDKIQARVYGLAAQVKYPQADKIWVEFDMLRHDGPVGRAFSRDDNIATYRFIQALAEKIIATGEGEGEETLNPTCLFCPRKQDCKALTKNIKHGGVFKLEEVGELVDQRAMLEWQAKAVAAAIKELDSIILPNAKELDAQFFESAVNRLDISVAGRRSIDGEMAEKVLGPELFEQYGGKTFTVGNAEKLIKSDELTPEQKAELRGLIYTNYGEPRVKIKPKNPIDGE